MDYFYNADGQIVIESMIKAIQRNKDYLGEIDGLVGDGDHGMNMNKGFTKAQTALADQPSSFTESLFILGDILFNEIGGSMGPIYGTIFTEMSEAASDYKQINLEVFSKMLSAGLSGLEDVVEARPGDKTLVDALSPAVDAINNAQIKGLGFKEALHDMKLASESGKNSTKDMVAKFGRSSRLGERSRGVIDAGAASCNIILQAMADALLDLIQREDMKQRIHTLLENA